MLPKVESLLGGRSSFEKNARMMNSSLAGFRAMMNKKTDSWSVFKLLGMFRFNLVDCGAPRLSNYLNSTSSETSFATALMIGE